MKSTVLAAMLLFLVPFCARAQEITNASGVLVDTFPGVPVGLGAFNHTEISKKRFSIENMLMISSGSKQGTHNQINVGDHVDVHVGINSKIDILFGGRCSGYENDKFGKHGCGLGAGLRLTFVTPVKNGEVDKIQLKIYAHAPDTSFNRSTDIGAEMVYHRRSARRTGVFLFIDGGLTRFRNNLAGYPYWTQGYMRGGIGFEFRHRRG